MAWQLETRQLLYKRLQSNGQGSLSGALFGNSSAKAVGTVYYDNITLEEILPEDYNAHSSSGTVITFRTPRQPKS